MAHRSAPVIVQIIITYFIIAFIVRAVRRSRKAARPPAGPGHKGSPATSETPPASRPSISAPPRAGAAHREERMYNGVVWQLVHRPYRDLSQLGSRASVDEVYVEEPPRCPKCGLGVLETHSWLGYTWSCPECGTRSRSQASIEETARMLARRR